MASPRKSLVERLKQAEQDTSKLLILDGPTGTELASNGFNLDRIGWSARAIEEAPELLLKVHQSFVDAGAEILTANTFRLHDGNLAAWGKRGASRELVKKAVQIARTAAGPNRYVVGSLAPVGDCYSPDEVPEQKVLIDAHQKLVTYLAEASVDAILVETHVSVLELKIACQAVQKIGVPLIVSVPTQDGRTMLDGSSLKIAAEAVAPFNPISVGINCAPVEVLETALEELNKVTALPKIVYANRGRLEENGKWSDTLGGNIAEHVELSSKWVNQGVCILGGCCGTTPELIAKFTEAHCHAN